MLLIYYYIYGNGLLGLHGVDGLEGGGVVTVARMTVARF